MTRKTLAPVIATVFVLAACGGGSTTEPTDEGSGGGVTPGSTKTSPGVWQGTITSSTTGTRDLLGMTDDDGHSIWMSTDGRVWTGQVPMSGAQADVSMASHMYPGDHFPDGTIHGTSAMHMDYADGHWTGHYSGAGDDGTFTMSRHPAWDRPASLATLAGTYTRTTSIGYTMTMTVSASGQITASDTRGCVITGTVTVPDAAHDLYRLAANVTSCGVLDGNYQGYGTLVDATAMQSWMNTMACFQYGQQGMPHDGMGHGGPGPGGMMPWWPLDGVNTVPDGANNLFMFAISNGQYAIMDALAK